MSFKAAPLFVLPLIVAPAAEAADPVVAPAPILIPPPAPFDPLWHAHIEGGPVYSDPGVTILGDSQDKFGTIPDNGFYVGAALRKLFRPNWTWQIAATATWFPSFSRNVDPAGFDATLAMDLDFQTLDLDIGFGSLHNRVFAGLRVLHVTDFLSYDNNNDFSVIDAEAWLLGPRVGVGGEMALGNPRFSVLAEVSGSVLFGHADLATDGDPFDPIPTSGSRTAYNLEGLLGLGWQMTEKATLTVGYRGQQWWGLRNATLVDTPNIGIAVDADKFIHGPFARLSVDW